MMGRHASLEAINLCVCMSEFVCLHYFLHILRPSTDKENDDWGEEAQEEDEDEEQRQQQYGSPVCSFT